MHRSEKVQWKVCCLNNQTNRLLSICSATAFFLRQNSPYCTFVENWTTRLVLWPSLAFQYMWGLFGLLASSFCWLLTLSVELSLEKAKGLDWCKSLFLFYFFIAVLFITKGIFLSYLRTSHFIPVHSHTFFVACSNVSEKW